MGIVENALTDSQKKLIRQMLEKDVPISQIKDELGLVDADTIYEVLYEGKVRNRISIASEKYLKSSSARKEDNSYNKVIEAISKLTKQRGPLKILEQGCGSGSFTRQIAELFPDCQVDGIELTAAGVKAANENNKFPNLNFWQADGYEVGKDKSYDIVYHVNVLEHVPDKEGYIAAGIKLLKKDGLLLFAFPTERYWRFWGTPKYLICRLLGKPFLIHGYSDKAIDDYLTRNNLTIVDKYFNGLYVPRRLYYYIPNKFLLAFGSYLGRLETKLRKLGYFSPIMFVFYAVSQDPSQCVMTSKLNNEMSLLNLWKNPLVLTQLFFLWFFSSLLMIHEVLSGRKTFFKQD